MGRLTKHPLLKTSQAAQLLGLSVRTLIRYRASGGGPPFVRCGSGLRGTVRYRREDLEAWLASRTRKSNAEVTR
jgi:predicted DNA-binding transcriptional regulator AlpA